MSRPLCSALALLVAALPVLAADDAYTLKLYKEKAGDAVKVTKVSKNDGTVKAVVGEMKVNDKLKGSEDVTYTDEYLEWPADAKRATKLKRVYEKVDKTNQKGDAVESALAGKTVVVERAKGKSTYTVDDKAPTEEQRKELDAEFAGKSDEVNKHDMMPGKPVKVGDTWAIDRKKVMAVMGEMKGFSVDADKCKFTGKLVKAATKDGVLSGTVEVTMTFALTDFPLGENTAVPTEAGSEMTITAAIDCCLDGSTPGEKTTLTMKMAVKAKLPNDGTLEVNTVNSGTETSQPVTKK